MASVEEIPLAQDSPLSHSAVDHGRCGPFPVSKSGEISPRGESVRMRQRAALAALRQAAGVETPGGGVQPIWQRWGRAAAEWLGLL